MLALFTFVRPNESRLNNKPPTCQQWNDSEFEELQLHALSALVTLAPRLKVDYVTCQGSTRLLLLLEWCVSDAGRCGGMAVCFGCVAMGVRQGIGIFRRMGVLYGVWFMLDAGWSDMVGYKEQMKRLTTSRVRCT